jgi:2,5-furandicarboxylate decarboxylase 1
MPVLSNTLASRSRLAIALETDPKQLTMEYARRQSELKPVVEVQKAPVKEVVIREEDIDLQKLPNITHCGGDGGPYISSGVVIMKDPISGIYNAGIYRIQIKGKNRLGIWPGAYSHGMQIIRANEREGRPTEVAIVIGHHPAVYLASQFRGPFEVSELEVAGGLLGEPLRVANGESVNLNILADAEIIIEGIIPPNVREEEGPFGEYTWYMGNKEITPIIKVSAITHRSDAIYYDINSAHPEHNLTGLLAREAMLYTRIKAVVPTLKAVTLPFSGTCRHTAYVSIKKEYDGLGKNAALSALAADPFMKLVIVVDEDIDVFNEAEVMWAVCTRVQAQQDVFIVPDAYVCELDPSAYSIKGRLERGYLNTKWAIDATKPVDLPFQERADVPEEVWRNIRIEDYIESFSS